MNGNKNTGGILQTLLQHSDPNHANQALYLMLSFLVGEVSGGGGFFFLYHENNKRHSEKKKNIVELKLSFDVK